MAAGIYQTKFFGVLEGSFVINIIVTTYHIIIQEHKSHQLIVFYTSICLAFIEILTILFFHVWHRLNLKWLYMKYCISCLIRKIEICFISSEGMPKVKDLDKPGGKV